MRKPELLDNAKKKCFMICFLTKKVVRGCLLVVVLVLGGAPAFAQFSSTARTIAVKNAGSLIKDAEFPELTFYMPDKASAVRFGLVKGGQSIWINALKSVCKPEGKGLQYTLTGRFIEKGKLIFDVLPLYQTDGVIVRICGEDLPDSLSLFWAFGAACGKSVSDVQPGLNPSDCKNNVFVVERNGMILYYPKGGLHEFSVFYTLFPIETSALLSDAHRQNSPLELFSSGHKTDAQALCGMFPIRNGQCYYCSFYKPSTNYDVNYYRLPAVFDEVKNEDPKNN